MVQTAARLMASRDLQQHWPASAAAQPLPGGAITTTAPVSVWAPRVEGHPYSENDQGKGLLSVSQFREVWVGARVHEGRVQALRKGRRLGECKRGRC